MALVIVVAATREVDAKQRTPGGTSAYASGSEEEPLSWQPRGPRTSTAPCERVRGGALAWQARGPRAGPVHASAAGAVGQLDLGVARLGQLVRVVERRVKAARFLNTCRISQSKTVGGLSDRQRAELIGLFHSR